MAAADVYGERFCDERRVNERGAGNGAATTGVWGGAVEGWGARTSTADWVFR